MKAIFILAGHSKYNPGASKNGLFERDFTKQIAQDLYDKIKNIKNIDVYLIGIDDLDLESKTEVVNQICQKNGYNLENSLLIEMHTNAGGGTGLESLIYDGYDPSIKLSDILLNETIKTTGLKNRGVKNGKQFYIIKNTIPLAIIFENGFIDTEKDREALKNNIVSFSEGIYNGLKKYIGFDDFNELDELRKENNLLKIENKSYKEKLGNINKMSLI